ncbi:MAG: hypothetical protein KBD36_01745 [Alphaproteobacteria bacterium]|jgi:hypothetical protein|nr:hypothetical protein [Alphaproteobacteria bacterium]MBP9776555.1 hypothetical protein [Alphaproteobacteria bacterium]
MTHLYKRNLNRKLWLCTGLVVGIAASFSQAYAESDHDKCNDACIQSMSAGLAQCHDNFKQDSLHHCKQAIDAGEAACKKECNTLFPASQ